MDGGLTGKDGKRFGSDQPVDRADDTTLLASKQERLLTSIFP